MRWQAAALKPQAQPRGPACPGAPLSEPAQNPLTGDCKCKRAVYCIANLVNHLAYVARAMRCTAPQTKRRALHPIPFYLQSPHLEILNRPSGSAGWAERRAGGRPCVRTPIPPRQGPSHRSGHSCLFAASCATAFNNGAGWRAISHWLNPFAAGWLVLRGFSARRFVLSFQPGQCPTCRLWHGFFPQRGGAQSGMI